MPVDKVSWQAWRVGSLSLVSRLLSAVPCPRDIQIVSFNEVEFQAFPGTHSTPRVPMSRPHAKHDVRLRCNIVLGTSLELEGGEEKKDYELIFVSFLFLFPIPSHR